MAFCCRRPEESTPEEPHNSGVVLDTPNLADADNDVSVKAT